MPAVHMLASSSAADANRLKANCLCLLSQGVCTPSGRMLRPLAACLSSKRQFGNTGLMSIVVVQPTVWPAD